MNKMYICVLDSFPDYMTPTLVGHAVLRHSIKYKNDSAYIDWETNSFRKCVVRVNEKEFDKILQLPNIETSWENNTLDGEVSCITIIANTNDHKVLKFAKLWKPLDKYFLTHTLENSCGRFTDTCTFNTEQDLVKHLIQQDLIESQIKELLNSKSISFTTGYESNDLELIVL